MSARPFAQLRVGEVAGWSHVLTDEEVDAFAALSGDDNPLHLDDDFARRQGFRGRVVHGMLLGAFLSRVLGTILPGPGVLWLSQTIRWSQAAYVQDRIEIGVEIKHLSPALRTMVLATTIHNHRKELLLSGEAKVMMLGQQASVPWSETVAVVTGGSRGIGAAIVRALAEKGARVVVNYRQDAEAADAVVAAIKSAGGDGLAVRADMASADGADALADAALDAFGRVDIVVNNASPPIVRKPFEELRWEDVDAYASIYLRGAFTLAQRVLPGMKERAFGRFIHVLTSAMWGTPPPGTSGYVAGKSAAWGLARGMAVELAPYGVTVNAVSPSAVMTDQWDGASDARRRALAMAVPARRLAGADEVASTVLFLAGSEAGYITGANLPVAGGEVM